MAGPIKNPVGIFPFPSHWKRGKKAIKDVESIETLSRNLNIDLEILQDLAEGSLALDEALCEFYDAEEEKSSALKNEPHHTDTELHHTNLRHTEPHTRTTILETIAVGVLTQISSKEIPIHIPKLINAFPFINVVKKMKVRLRIIFIPGGIKPCHCRTITNNIYSSNYFYTIIDLFLR